MTRTLYAIASAAIFFSATTTADSGEGEFINYMTRLQYFSHKLSLAIDAGNKDLQHFYAYEVEEQIEAASEIKQLDGLEVSELMAQSQMNVSQAIAARRAIKWYDPDHRMPEETLRNLMEHAILTPTAFNVQSWRRLLTSSAFPPSARSRL